MALTPSGAITLPAVYWGIQSPSSTPLGNDYLWRALALGLLFDGITHTYMSRRCICGDRDVAQVLIDHGRVLRPLTLVWTYHISSAPVVRRALTNDEWLTMRGACDSVWSSTNREHVGLFAGLSG